MQLHVTLCTEETPNNTNVMQQTMNLPVFLVYYVLDNFKNII